MAQVTTSVKGLSKERLKGGHQKETKIVWESETELMMEDLSGMANPVQLKRVSEELCKSMCNGLMMLSSKSQKFKNV